MLPSRHLQRILFVVAIALLAFAAGCSSSDRSAVKGSVKFEGDSVDQGGVAFLPLGGGDGKEQVRATGQIENGAYAFDDYRGPNPGKYRVELTWNKKTGRKVPGEGGVMKDETVQVVPAKYNTASELVVEVKRGANTFDFDLKK